MGVPGCERRLGERRGSKHLGDAEQPDPCVGQHQRRGVHPRGGVRLGKFRREASAAPSGTGGGALPRARWDLQTKDRQSSSWSSPHGPLEPWRRF